MEAFNSVFIVNIVFALLQCVWCMRADCYEREYKLLPGGYNIYMANGVQPVFKTVKGISIRECGQMCADEKFCNVWRFGGRTCQIFHAMKDNVTARISTDTTTKTYYETEEDDQWMKIYSVKSKSGILVAETFLGTGIFKSWMPAHCTLKNCPDFFRSFFIDVWSSLPVMKVKLSLFKNNTVILHLVFDGQGTNSENWYTMSRVLKSPWKDVYKGAPYNCFLINFRSLRTFYASKTHNGCPNDIGWIAVIEPKQACSWDRQVAYPYILYSDKEYATQWEKGHGIADALAVYISF